MKIYSINIIVYSAKNVLSRTGKNKFCLHVKVGSEKQKSEVVEDLFNNPNFNKHFLFHTDNLEQDLKLKLTEKHDRDVLGQVIVPLSDLGQVKAYLPERVPLRSHKRCPRACGELLFDAWISMEKNYFVTNNKKGMSKKAMSNESLKTMGGGLKKFKDKFHSSVFKLSLSKEDEKEKNKRKKLGEIFSIKNRGAFSCQDLSSKQTPQLKINFKPFKSPIESQKISKNSYEAKSQHPEVNGLSPNTADSRGGTMVVIRGENLGKNEQDLVHVYICGVDMVHRTKYISSSKLMCTLLPCQPCSGNVLVETKSGGIGNSSVEFSFVEKNNFQRDFDEVSLSSSNSGNQKKFQEEEDEEKNSGKLSWNGSFKLRDLSVIAEENGVKPVLSAHKSSPTAPLKSYENKINSVNFAFCHKTNQNKSFNEEKLKLKEINNSEKLILNSKNSEINSYNIESEIKNNLIQQNKNAEDEGPLDIQQKKREKENNKNQKQHEEEKEQEDNFQYLISKLTEKTDNKEKKNKISIHNISRKEKKYFENNNEFDTSISNQSSSFISSSKSSIIFPFNSQSKSSSQTEFSSAIPSSFSYKFPNSDFFLCNELHSPSTSPPKKPIYPPSNYVPKASEISLTLSPLKQTPPKPFPPKIYSLESSSDLLPPSFANSTFSQKNSLGSEITDKKCCKENKINFSFPNSKLSQQTKINDLKIKNSNYEKIIFKSEEKKKIFYDKQDFSSKIETTINVNKDPIKLISSSKSSCCSSVRSSSSDEDEDERDQTNLSFDFYLTPSPKPPQRKGSRNSMIETIYESVEEKEEKEETVFFLIDSSPYLKSNSTNSSFRKKILPDRNRFIKMDLNEEKDEKSKTKDSKKNIQNNIHQNPDIKLSSTAQDLNFCSFKKSHLPPKPPRLQELADIYDLSHKKTQDLKDNLKLTEAEDHFKATAVISGNLIQQIKEEISCTGLTSNPLHGNHLNQLLDDLNNIYQSKEESLKKLEIKNQTLQEERDLLRKYIEVLISRALTACPEILGKDDNFTFNY